VLRCALVATISRRPETARWPTRSRSRRRPRGPRRARDQDDAEAPRDSGAACRRSPPRGAIAGRAPARDPGRRRGHRDRGSSPRASAPRDLRGLHGRSGLTRALVGSVAESAAPRDPRAVLRACWAAGADGAGPDVRKRTVCPEVSAGHRTSAGCVNLARSRRHSRMQWLAPNHFARIEAHLSRRDRDISRRSDQDARRAEHAGSDATNPSHR